MISKTSIQTDALNIALNNKRCTLAISMGVGKTKIGLDYIDALRKENPHIKVLVVIPKLTLIDTWKEESQKFGIDITNIEFVTYLSLTKKDSTNYEVVILDESHNLLFKHNSFLSGYKNRILGLTGTPPRYSTSEKGIMTNTFCPIKYQYLVDDAVTDSLLNDYKIHVHLLKLSAIKNVKITTKSGGTFYTSEIEQYNYWTQQVDSASTKAQKRISAIMRMKKMMEFRTKEQYVKEMLERIEDKCIIFANTQEQADLLCSHSFHSNNPLSEENLKYFKEGYIDKLSCVLQLNEGVSIPHLKSGIILHSYGNERKTIQRLGRLLRLNPDDSSLVHMLCYKDTIDEYWLKQSLKDLDQSKIKYFKADEI